MHKATRFAMVSPVADKSANNLIIELQKMLTLLRGYGITITSVEADGDTSIRGAAEAFGLLVHAHPPGCHVS